MAASYFEAFHMGVGNRSVPPRFFFASGEIGGTVTAGAQNLSPDTDQGVTAASAAGSGAMKSALGTAARWKWDAFPSPVNRLMTTTPYRDGFGTFYGAFSYRDPTTGAALWTHAPGGVASIARSQRVNYVNGMWVVEYHDISGGIVALASSADGVVWDAQQIGGVTAVFAPMLYTDRWVTIYALDPTASYTVVGTGAAPTGMTTAADVVTGFYPYTAYDGTGTVVAVPANNASAVWRSTSNGAAGTWATVAQTYHVAGTPYWDGVAYIAGRFVGVGVVYTGSVYDHFIATSLDGATWTYTSTGTSAQRSNQCIASNGSVIVRSKGSTSGPSANQTLYHSTDGLSWTTDATYTSVGSCFIKAAADGSFYRSFYYPSVPPSAKTLYVSSDGVNWTALFPVTCNSFIDADYGPITQPRDQLLQVRTGGGTVWSTVETVHPSVQGMFQRQLGTVRADRDGGIFAAAELTGDFFKWSANGSGWSTTTAQGTIYAKWLNAWFSFTSAGWQKVTVPGLVFTSGLYAVANSRIVTTVATDTAFYQLRYGSAGSGTRGLFTSTDGVNWTQVLTESSANYGGQTITTTNPSWTLSYAKDSKLLGLHGFNSSTSTNRYLTVPAATVGSSVFTIRDTVAGNARPMAADGAFYRMENISTTSTNWVIQFSNDAITWVAMTIVLPVAATLNGASWIVRCGLPLGGEIVRGPRRMTGAGSGGIY